MRLKNILALPDEAGLDSYMWIKIGNKYKWADDSEERFKKALENPTVVQLANQCDQYLDAGLLDLASEEITDMYAKADSISLEVKKAPNKKLY